MAPSSKSRSQDDSVEATKRTKLRRFPIRGHFDRETINRILDSATMAHIAFDHEGPAILPMVFWRRDDHVYFHGSARNRMFDSLGRSKQCCFAASLIDAYVLARAALHHSVNYRSVVIYGAAEEVADDTAKLDALRGLIERFYPGRWGHIRPPSPEEFASVRVFRLPIEEASAKIRTGQPTPYKEDFGMSVWAGIVPVGAQLGAPETDPHTPAETPPQDLATLTRIVETPAEGD